MSATCTRPVPKTLAFGGVATGKRKANDDDTATGNMKNSGLVSSDLKTLVILILFVWSISAHLASSATIGMKIEAMTVFEQMLVRPTVIQIQMSIMTLTGKTESRCITSPISIDK